MTLMAQVAWGVKDMAPEHIRLDSDVYFIARDRRVQRVGRGAEGEGVRIETRGPIGDVLRGLVESELGGRQE
jgi:hypothetical protein